jgi:endonuclease/exonuclease/phosphatase (EEP) superfamily protein YafD
MVNPLPDELLADVFAAGPDVVAFEEYTPRLAAAIEPYRAVYPYAVERPATHSFGEAVFSRLPLESVDEHDAGAPALDVVVRVEGRPVRILVVHTLPPISGENLDRWRQELDWLAGYAAALDPDEALVVAGDLNATPYHPSFRRLLRAGGLRDAHAEVGRPLATTWPNGLLRVPPLQLDHVLLRGPVRARAVAERTGPGSDHRPVLADLLVER